MDRAVVSEFHAGRGLAVKYQPVYHGVGEHGQIWAVHVRKNVRAVGGLAVSVADTKVDDSGAAAPFHHPAVLVFKRWDSHRLRAVEQRVRDRAGIGRGLNEHRSPGSPVIGIRSTMLVLDAAVDLEHGAVVP